MRKATVKGHGLAVGDKVNFYGTAKDGFPSPEGTLCVLGKDGNKYTLTSVTEVHKSTGKPWVWTFGASAEVWASPVIPIHMNTEHGPTAYTAGCGVEVSDRHISNDRAKATCADCLAMPVSTDHCFESHSRRPWECRLCKRPRVQHVTPAPSTTNPWGECGPCDGTDAPMARQAHPCGLMSASKPLAPVTADGFCPDGKCGTCADCVKCAGVVESNLSVFAEAMAEVERDEAMEVPAPAFSAGDDLVSFKGQRVHVLGRAVEDGAWWYEVREFGGGAHSERLYAHERDLSVYSYTPQVGDRILDVTTGTVATVTRADEFWIGLSPDRIIRPEHFTMHITAGAFIPVTGEAEVPATGEHAVPTNTPVIAGYYWQRYVIPGDLVTALSTYQLVAEGSKGCQVAATVKYVKDGLWQATGCVWMSTALTPGTYWDGEPLADAFGHVAQYMTWVASVRGSGLTWVDINRLDWRTPYVPTPTPETAPKISKPVRTGLNRRTRKQAKRHAFAGKR